jgi:hypothetical protein
MGDKRHLRTAARLPDDVGQIWNESNGMIAAHPLTVHTIPVKNLTVTDSPRLAGVDHAHVVRLAECDGDLPPIVVHRETMRVIDGSHRLQAAIRNKRDLVDIVYFDGSEDDAFALAVELNIKHGLPLSLRDRKAAASRILTNGADLSDRAIAATTGLSDKTIAAIRVRLGAESPHLATRRGRDGHAYPVDRAERRRRVVRMLGERPGASAREIASAAGVSRATVSDIRKRLTAGQDSASTLGLPERGVGTASKTGVHALDKQAALERLRSDPSFRGNEVCRDLLRWLCAHTIDAADLPESTEGIPSHRIELVISLARQTALTWLEFARRLETERHREAIPARSR